ncbi:MAG: polysaccharide biosynthesis protein [Marinobacter sp.]|nr:polysaccharide biosynthesis protein [Marinobacter sp.]
MGRRERTAEQPDGEIERVFSGLRPGEKLFEELLIGDDPHSLHGQALLPSRSHKRNKRMASRWFPLCGNVCSSSRLQVHQGGIS